MTKHAPGPWTNVDGAYFINARSAAGVVADIRIAGGRITDEDRANARLIAAAPDMLNALLDVLDFWDDPNMSMSELKGRVRDAIAKAQGED